jgi:hypothetical protein
LHSSRYSNGFKIKVKSKILIGQPCLTEYRMGKGPARWTLICTQENAWSYIVFMIAMKRLLYPYLCSIRNRYVCEILSKAAVKSKERIHSGALHMLWHPTLSPPHRRS